MLMLLHNMFEVYQMKNVKDILRNLREDNDLSQAQAAQIIGTTQQHYWKFEKGANAVPLHVINTLADYYGVSADYLLGRTACKEGIDGLNAIIYGNVTVGAFISDVLQLNEKNRALAAELISLIKIKQETDSK